MVGRFRRLPHDAKVIAVLLVIGMGAKTWLDVIMDRQKIWTAQAAKYQARASMQMAKAADQQAEAAVDHVAAVRVAAEAAEKQGNRLVTATWALAITSALLVVVTVVLVFVTARR